MQSFSPFKMALFPSLGYWVGDLLLYPVDTVVTRLRANPALKQNLSSIKQCFSQIRKNEGMKGLFRGCKLTVMTSLVPSTLYFYTYEVLMHKINSIVNQNFKEKKWITLFFPFFVSSFSQVISLLVYAPFDLVRTRIQSGQSKYQNSLLTSFNIIHKQEGISRLFKSSHLYALNMLFFTGIQFQILQTLRYATKVQTILHILAATFISTIVTNPLDYMMTRHVLLNDAKKLSTVSMIKQIMKEEGLQAFMKGVSGKLLINLGYNLSWFPIYSYLRSYGWNSQKSSLS